MFATRIVFLCFLGVGFFSAEAEDQPPFDWTALDLQVADLVQRGRIDESIIVLEGGIKAVRGRGGAGSGLAEALNDLGSLYVNSGRFIEAERVYKESLLLWARSPVTSPKMGTVLGNLASLRVVQGRLSEAEKLYGDAKRLQVTAHGVESPEVAFVLCGLAGVYWETRRYEEAREAGERALTVLENTGPGAQTGVALFLLAKVAWKQKREFDAERLLRRAIEVWRKSLGPQHPTYASGLATLAVLLSRKDRSESTRLFRESLENVEAQRGPDHWFTGYFLVLYARHLEALGRRQEARALKRRGEAILTKHSRENLLGSTLDIKAFQNPYAR